MKIVVLAGGLSPERNVSLSSGVMVCEALRERGHQAAFLDLYMGVEGFDGAPEDLFTAPLPMELRKVDGRVPDLEALRRSRAITHGHRWQAVRLGLRFLGWDILCIFTLGIGLIWLWPYVVTSGMVFYRACMPQPGEESYEKLPPVKRQSTITAKISWALVILVLLLFILANFTGDMESAREIAAKYTVTETAQ